MRVSGGCASLRMAIAARDKQIDSGKVKAHAVAGTQIAIPLKIKPIHEDLRKTEASARLSGSWSRQILEYE